MKHQKKQKLFVSMMAVVMIISLVLPLIATIFSH